MQSALQTQSKLFIFKRKAAHTTFVKSYLASKTGLSHHLGAVGEQLGKDVEAKNMPVGPNSFKKQQALKPDPAPRIQPAAAMRKLQRLYDGTEQRLA